MFEWKQSVNTTSARSQCGGLANEPINLFIQSSKRCLVAFGVQRLACITFEY
jgi:hypothetical protein